jgi:hypothetical protein
MEIENPKAGENKSNPSRLKRKYDSGSEKDLNQLRAKLVSAVNIQSTLFRIHDRHFQWLLPGDLESLNRFSRIEIRNARSKYGMGKLNLVGSLEWAAKILKKPSVMQSILK